MRKAKLSLGSVGGTLEESDSDGSEEPNRFAGWHGAASFAVPQVARHGRKPRESTMIDYFLQGDEKQNAAKLVDHGVVRFIPDPPGVEDPETIKKRRNKRRRHLQAMLLEHQVKQCKHALEGQVQEYWKRYAVWPQSWPETQEAREMQTKFAAEFRQYSLVVAPDAAGITKADAVVSRSFKTFVCVASGKVGIRSCPTTDDSSEHMTGNVLNPGQVVISENVVVIENVRYIKLSTQSGDGWVFECKGDVEVMAELTAVETGFWWYRVACTEFVEIRQVPSYSRRFGTGWVMCPNEVCVVSLRAKLFGSAFCQLADGRGWVFLMKSQDALMQNQNASPVVLEQADQADMHKDLAAYDLNGDGHINDDELEAALMTGMDGAATGVESGLWQYQVLDEPVVCYGNTLNGSTLMPKETFAVDLRAPASGKKTKEVSAKTGKSPVLDRTWLRLYDGRGWIPKEDTDGKPLVRFEGSGGAQKLKPPRDRLPKEQWMYGIA